MDGPRDGGWGGTFSQAVQNQNLTAGRDKPGEGERLQKEITKRMERTARPGGGGEVKNRPEKTGKTCWQQGNSSIHPPVHPSTHLSIHPSIYPLIYPSTIHPPTHPSTCPSSTHPSVHPSTHSSINLPIHPSVHPSIDPFIQPSTHSSIRPSVRRGAETSHFCPGPMLLQNQPSTGRPWDPLPTGRLAGAAWAQVHSRQLRRRPASERCCSSGPRTWRSPEPR